MQTPSIPGYVAVWIGKGRRCGEAFCPHLHGPCSRRIAQVGPWRRRQQVLPTKHGQLVPQNKQTECTQPFPRLFRVIFCNNVLIRRYKNFATDKSYLNTAINKFFCNIHNVFSHRFSTFPPCWCHRTLESLSIFRTPPENLKSPTPYARIAATFKTKIVITITLTFKNLASYI